MANTCFGNSGICSNYPMKLDFWDSFAEKQKKTANAIKIMISSEESLQKNFVQSSCNLELTMQRKLTSCMENVNVTKIANFAWFSIFFRKQISRKVIGPQPETYLG